MQRRFVDSEGTKAGAEAMERRKCIEGLPTWKAGAMERGKCIEGTLVSKAGATQMRCHSRNVDLRMIASGKLGHWTHSK